MCITHWSQSLLSMIALLVWWHHCDLPIKINLFILRDSLYGDAAKLEQNAKSKKSKWFVLEALVPEYQPVVKSEMIAVCVTTCTLHCNTDLVSCGSICGCLRVILSLQVFHLRRFRVCMYLSSRHDRWFTSPSFACVSCTVDERLTMMSVYSFFFLLRTLRLAKFNSTDCRSVEYVNFSLMVAHSRPLYFELHINPHCHSCRSWNTFRWLSCWLLLINTQSLPWHRKGIWP